MAYAREVYLHILKFMLMLPKLRTVMGMNEIYLGTWQFEQIGGAQREALVNAAHEQGISRFDTAAVYASGEAESVLGRMMSAGDTVVTKIPAVNKNTSNFSDAYPDEHVKRVLGESSSRLNRVPDGVLLHNWSAAWEGPENTEKVVSVLESMHVPSVGVSLPNRYTGTIESSEVFNLINNVELPYNQLSPLLTRERIALMTLSKNVLVRSLFMHGNDVRDVKVRISDISNLGARPVVGATLPSQIESWL